MLLHRSLVLKCRGALSLNDPQDSHQTINLEQDKFVIFERSMKAFRTISSILLMLLVLVSSTSFIVGMHVCMGDVQNVAIFAKADGCEKERQLPPCHRETSEPCCEDEALMHDAEELKVSSAPAHINTLVASDIGQAVAVIAEIIPSAPIFTTRYTHYIPPLRSADLTVEHRVFLI